MERLNDEFNTFKADYISSEGTERGMLAEWRSQTALAEPEAVPPTEQALPQASGTMKEKFNALPESEQKKVLSKLTSEEKAALGLTQPRKSRKQRRNQ